MKTSKTVFGVLFFFLLLLFTAGICLSSDKSDYLDDFEDTSDLNNFEEISKSTESESIVSTKPEKPSIFNFQGDLTLFIANNIAHKKPEQGQTDWRGLSSQKNELFFEFDTNIAESWEMKISASGFYDAAFSLNKRSDYSDEILNEDEKGAELRKAYISGSVTDNLDIKIGRQIVVWGKSDNIRVNDIINPINMKTPGITDLEDIRLPLFMTKLDYYLGSWNLCAIAVHEKRFNKLPEYGSDYYIYEIKIPEHKPSNNFSNTEYAISLNGNFTGWDVALYYADFYDKTPYFKIVSFLDAQFELLYSQQTMIGADINIALGNFLLKSEIAYFKSVDFSDYLAMSDNIYFRREMQKPCSLIKSLGGIEYTGFKDTSISVDVMNKYVEDLDQHAIEAMISKNSWETAIRINRNFLNEKLSATLLAMLYGKNIDEGSVWRISGEYDLRDNFVITAGAIFYDGDEMILLKNFKDNDRIYTSFEYSF